MNSSAIPVDILSRFLLMIDEGSTFRLLLLSGTLMWVGDKVVHQRLRAYRRGNVTGVSAMLFYWVYGWLRFGSYEAGTLLFIAWRGILLACLTFGPAWVFFSILEYVDQTFIHPARWRFNRQWMTWLSSWRSRIEGKRQLREQIQADAIWEAGRPERERLQREEDQRDQQKIDRLEGALQEYRQVHIELTLLYNKHRKELKKRLTEIEFKQLLGRLLDEKTATDVRQRANAIRTCIDEIIANTNIGDPVETGATTVERMEQVADEIDAIEQGLSRFDPETRETLESILHEAKAQKLSQLLNE